MGTSTALAPTRTKPRSPRGVGAVRGGSAWRRAGRRPDAGGDHRARRTSTAPSPRPRPGPATARPGSTAAGPGPGASTTAPAPPEPRALRREPHLRVSPSDDRRRDPGNAERRLTASSARPSRRCGPARSTPGAGQAIPPLAWRGPPAAGPRSRSSPHGPAAGPSRRRCRPPAAQLGLDAKRAAAAQEGPPAHPPEPAYPCCLPARGGSQDDATRGSSLTVEESVERPDAARTLPSHDAPARARLPPPRS